MQLVQWQITGLSDECVPGVVWSRATEFTEYSTVRTPTDGTRSITCVQRFPSRFEYNGVSCMVSRPVAVYALAPLVV